MSISFEQMQILLQQQQKQFELSQLKLIETLTQKLNIQSTASIKPETSRPLIETISNSITDFHYDPAAGVHFDSWFRKYEDSFRLELAETDDAQKVRLLLRKLGPAEHERYSNYILPKNPRDFSFEDTVTCLSTIFGEQSSLFNIRYHCLKLAKNESDDFVTYAGVINREAERFKLRTMTDDQFKCLLFVCGLQSPIDADIRTRILSKMELDPDMTLQSITTECQRLLNLKHDAKMIEHAHGTSSVNAMQSSFGRSQHKEFNAKLINSKPQLAGNVASGIT